MGPDQTNTERGEDHAGRQGGRFGPQDGRSQTHRVRSAEFLVRPSTLRADEHQAIGRCRCPSTSFGEDRTRCPQIGEVTDRDIGEANATTLGRRRTCHGPESSQLALGAIARPSHDGAGRDEGHDAVDPELGELLHHPLGTIALDRGEPDTDPVRRRRLAIDRRRPDPTPRRRRSRTAATILPRPTRTPARPAAAAGPDSGDGSRRHRGAGSRGRRRRPGRRPGAATAGPARRVPPPRRPS